MHPCSVNWVEIGCAVVYHAQAAHAFSAGKTSWYCTQLESAGGCSRARYGRSQTPQFLCQNISNKQRQYISNLEGGSCEVLELSRVYPKTLLGSKFYSVCCCPLRKEFILVITINPQIRITYLKIF